MEGTNLFAVLARAHLLVMLPYLALTVQEQILSLSLRLVQTLQQAVSLQ